MYSLEVPHKGAFNEYSQHSFYGEIRKIIDGYPLLSVAVDIDICIYIERENFPI